MKLYQNVFKNSSTQKRETREHNQNYLKRNLKQKTQKYISNVRFILIIICGVKKTSQTAICVKQKQRNQRKEEEKKELVIYQYGVT